MTYAASSPIRGAGVASAAAIDAWFRSHNAAAPALGAAIVAECGAVGVNSDLVSAQIAHETGYWSSDWALNHDNPAGVGVTGAPGVGITFPTIRAGIHAQVAHLLTYVLGAANPLKADDPRYSAAMSAGYGGSVHVLGDLDGRWAVPGVGYGQSIATLANALVATAGTQGGGTVTGRDPQAQWQPSSNFNAGRAGYVVDHITCHLTAGTSSLSWLRGAAGGSSNANSSATYLIARDGTVYQLVDEADTPWTDGNLLFNQTGISIEHEANDGQGFTDAQIAASVGLIARIAARQGWTHVTHPTDAVLPETGPPGTAVVIGHYQVPDPGNATLGGGLDHHTGCPGPLFPWQRVIDGANAILGGAAPVTMGANAPAAPDVVTLNGHTLGHGFRAFWDKFGGLAVFGYPITEEISESGLTVQYFERARFEWHPGSDPSKYDVMLGRVGSELYALKHPTT